MVRLESESVAFASRTLVVAPLIAKGILVADRTVLAGDDACQFAGYYLKWERRLSLRPWYPLEGVRRDRLQRTVAKVGFGSAAKSIGDANT
jgi:hypothetical protein